MAVVADFADRQPDTRVFLVFHHREDGPEADDISKAFLATEQDPSKTRLQRASECLQQRGFTALTELNRLSDMA